MLGYYCASVWNYGVSGHVFKPCVLALEDEVCGMRYVESLTAGPAVAIQSV